MSDFNKSLFERGMDLVPLINQADLNGTIVTGDWIKLLHYQRVGILLAKYGSEDVDDTGLQFLQSATNGGSSKALSVQPGRPVHYKTGTLTSQTVWTQVAVTSAIDGLAFGASVPSGFTRVVADVNTSPLLLYTEILAEDLDADNGYAWLTAFFGNNVNNSLLVSVWAILMGGKFPQAVPLSCIS